MASYKLNRNQRDALNNFMNITSETEARSMKYLEKMKWNYEAALDEYYENPPPPLVDEKALEATFYHCSGDKDVNEIRGENLQKFFKELQVDLNDVLPLFIAFQFKSKKIGVFSKEEFISGMKKLGCQTLANLRDKLPNLRSDLSNEKIFKEFYFYIFDYAKGAPQKKVLDLDFAIAMWQTILGNKYNLTNDWVEFLKKEYNRPISRDTWNLFLDFSRSDINKYNTEGLLTFTYDTCFSQVLLLP